MSFRGKNDFLSSGMRTLRHYPSKCGICLDEFAEFNSPSDTHSPVQIRCGHIVGRSCLVNRANNTTRPNHNKCPICLDRLFEKDRSGNPSNSSSSRTNDPSRASYHTARSSFTTRREDTNPRRKASRNEHQVTSRYPPAPTAVTPTPSEDSLYGHTLRHVSARIPTQRPTAHGNTTPSSSRNPPRVDPRSNVAPQGPSRDQPRFESRSTAMPSGTPRSTAPVTPRVPMLNPAWPGNPLPTRAASPAPSTVRTDTSSIRRYTAYVDTRRNPNISAWGEGPPPPLDGWTDSESSSGSDGTWS